ncbi:extended synaptotagmin-1 [Chanos chanos]|uniref:Extended synaptotagmin-1 n=1 Tax=Chanos chanos TaxID=29144 RepID=A0A6J2VUX5_CHACN|nr:extended synaptotagmin-1-like [Chanos chanos]
MSDKDKDTGPGGSTASGQADKPQSGDGASKNVEPVVPKPKGIDAMAILWTFGKCLSALLPVYLAGYYRVSTSLVVFGLMVYSGWKHSREAKEARLRSAIQLLGNEQEYTSAKMLKSKRDLPAWVNFPDVEKVEWLNKVLQQAWPFIGQYLEKLLVETIAPSIRASSTHLQTFNFTKIDMGDKAMKVVGVKAHTENDKGQVLLDVYISYVGNVEINVEVKRYFCKAGVKGIQLHGMMRVILEPLIGDVPIVGAVTMFFIQRPKLDINWTGLTNLLDIPGLNVMSDTMIMDIIASFLVLPNRLTVPLVPNLHVAQLRSPLPRGVVRIHLVEADGLAAKDNYVRGVIAGMSDPYALLRVGPQTFTSHHQDNTLNPKWGEMYEVIVHEVPGQELEVEVYDKDPDKDDFLGRTKLDLGIVKKCGVVDEWFSLKDAASGRVHLRLEWLNLLSNADRLGEVLKRNETVISKTADPPSAAILAVYLDRAEALPMKKGNKDPSPMVQLSVRDITKESRTCWNTTEPQWEDAFTFFIQDPNKQDIDIQVKDNDRVQTLGSLTVPLSRLLSCPDLSLDQWFQLDKSGPASRVYITTVLRVLWLDEEAVSSSLLSSEATHRSVTRPQQTSPDPSFATEGVLRIHLVEGQNLVAKDNLMGGLRKGKSDPYVKINIGGTTFKSQTIKENLNPTWNEMYEVVLTRIPGQEVLFEVFDKDMDKDDFMGRLKIKLSDIITSEHTDDWFTLNDVKSGRIHLVLEWLPMLSHADTLDQVLRCQALASYKNKTVPAVALLFVYLESAHDLPLKKSGKEPKAGAELVLGRTSHKTKVCDRTSSPQWDEAFHFLVHDPKKEDLIVRLFHCWDIALGSLVIPIRDLLSEPELMLDQWLSLDGASPSSQILLRAQLKILSPKMAESCVDREDRPSVPEGEPRPEKDSLQRSAEKIGPSAPVSISSSVSGSDEATTATASKVTPTEVIGSADLRPEHTSPDPSFGTEGVLRIHLMEAQSLIAKDNLMGGLKKGKSDPYVKINVGDMKFKSHVIKENLNPTWNKMYELVLDPNSAEDIHMEVFDKDIDKDDFLGRCNISIKDVIQAHYTDQWFTLNDVKSGRVHLILEWIPKASHPDTLDQVLQLQSVHYQNKTVPSAALLFVLIERAHSLPLKKSGKEPKAGAELVLGGTSYRTKVCDRSTSPQWDESFHFLVRHPKEDMLVIKLSSGWDQPMGSLVLPVRELLSKPELVLDQWLNLDGATSESQILLRAQLRVLDSEMAKGDLTKSPSGLDSSMGGGDSEEREPISVTEQLSVKDNQEMPQLEEPVRTRPSEPVAPSAPEPAVPSQPEEQEEMTSEVIADPHPSDSTPVGSSETAMQDLSDVPVSTSAVGRESKDMEPVGKTGSDRTASADLQYEDSSEGQSLEPVLRDDLVTVGGAEETSEDTSLTDLRPQRSCPDSGFGAEGVLRIHVLEAQDLIAKDNLMGGLKKGKSDPYVKINVGNVNFKSHVIKENLNPTWNEMFETVLSPKQELEVKFELYDKDIDSDDFLGRFTLKLGDIISSQYMDQWFTLNDVKSGRVHLVLEWIPKLSHADTLDQVLQLQRVHYQNKTVPSAALLFVLIERAHSLPLKKSGKEPKAGAELSLGGTSYKTKLCDRTTSPLWHESFYFLVHNPKDDMLFIKLSSGWDQPMGSLVLPMREILSKPELVLDQWLTLDGATPDSQILLMAQLRILGSKMATLVAMGQGPKLANAPAGQTGKVRISLSYQKRLSVTIHACRGLTASSKDGLDTYVSLFLQPDKNKATKRKTSVKKKELNPEYNEKFEFDLSLEDAKRRTLSVCVKNSSASFMSRDKDVIGQVQIELAQFDLLSGVTEWFDLEDD